MGVTGAEFWGLHESAAVSFSAHGFWRTYACISLACTLYNHLQMQFKDNIASRPYTPHSVFHAHQHQSPIIGMLNGYLLTDSATTPRPRLPSHHIVIGRGWKMCLKNRMCILCVGQGNVPLPESHEMHRRPEPHGTERRRQQASADLQVISGRLARPSERTWVLSPPHWVSAILPGGPP